MKIKTWKDNSFAEQRALFTLPSRACRSVNSSCWTYLADVHLSSRNSPHVFPCMLLTEGRTPLRLRMASRRGRGPSSELRKVQVVATLLLVRTRNKRRDSKVLGGISSSSAWHRDAVCVRRLSVTLAGLPRKSASTKDRFLSGLGFRPPFILTQCVRADAWRGGLFTSWCQEEEEEKRERGRGQHPSIPFQGTILAPKDSN